MPEKPDEQMLLWVSVGIVVLTILAIIVFILNQLILFYVIAIIAIVLGFYLSRSLARSSQEPQAQTGKNKKGK